MPADSAGTAEKFVVSSSTSLSFIFNNHKTGVAMRKMVVAEFITRDGVMEAPEEWQPAYVSDDVAEEIQGAIHAAEASLFGRATYEMFAAYWPLQTHNEFGIADKLSSQPKYVVSSTLEKVEWNNSTLIQGNLAEEFRHLKQQHGGDIRLVGSATLVQPLMKVGLIDEYWLLVHPLVLGRGKRLFDDGMKPTALKLLEVKGFSSGVVLLRYQPIKK
jgi:dihydrofolate reductase